MVSTESEITTSHTLEVAVPKSRNRWMVIGLVALVISLGVGLKLSGMRLASRLKALKPIQKKLLLVEKSGKPISVLFTGPAEFLSDQCQGAYQIEKQWMDSEEPGRSNAIEVVVPKGRVYSDAGCKQPLKSLSLPEGSQNTSFYLRDTEGISGLIPIRLEVRIIETPAGPAVSPLQVAKRELKPTKKRAINHTTKLTAKRSVKKKSKPAVNIATRKRMP